MCPLLAPKNAMHSHFASLNSSKAHIYLQLDSGLRSTPLQMHFVPPNSLETQLYLQLTSGPRTKVRTDNCK